VVNTYQHADVYSLMGFSLRKTGDYTNALTFYKKALDFDADHKGAHEYLGELYVETGQLQQAKEQLATLEKLCPQGCEEREDLEIAIAATAPKTN
jgi:tetratricopeptide (TPR) repeat protein